MNQAKFAASQSVSIAVPDEKISMRHYLRQPQRLIYALVDPSQAEQLAEDCFRLKMRSRQFLMLTLQPIVDIKLWIDGDGILRLKAIKCELGGIDFVNHHFQLDLEGCLFLNDQQCLEGQADLAVAVDIPPMLWMTPKSIVNGAGQSMLKGILATVKNRLVQQIIVDYQQWARTVTDSHQKELVTQSKAFPELS